MGKQAGMCIRDLYLTTIKMFKGSEGRLLERSKWQKKTVMVWQSPQHWWWLGGAAGRPGGCASEPHAGPTAKASESQPHAGPTAKASEAPRASARISTGKHVQQSCVTPWPKPSLGGVMWPAGEASPRCRHRHRHRPLLSGDRAGPPPVTWDFRSVSYEEGVPGQVCIHTGLWGAAPPTVRAELEGSPRAPRTRGLHPRPALSWESSWTPRCHLESKIVEKTLAKWEEGYNTQVSFKDTKHTIPKKTFCRRLGLWQGALLPSSAIYECFLKK